MAAPDGPRVEVKVGVLGASGVGKTALITRVRQIINT